MVYEQRLARKAYAYGVDLRRNTWLDHSTFGEPLMRGVDRRWNELAEALHRDELEPPRQAPPTPMLEEIARLVKLLRAPLPTVKVLGSRASREIWPTVTALAPRGGATHWLILDVARLRHLDPTSVTFLLASGLGHLQCDHGPLFAAHLMAQRAGRGLRWLRAAFRPWSRVAFFSADRAALLGLAELEPTIEALRARGNPGVSWYPVMPSLELREQALREFDKSRIMAKLRFFYEDPANWSVGPETTPSEAAEQTNGTSKAKAGDTKPPVTESPKAQVPKASPKDDESEQASEEEAAAAERRAKAAALEARVAEAWSLARCDARLTRRLGLL